MLTIITYLNSKVSLIQVQKGGWQFIFDHISGDHGWTDLILFGLDF